MKLFFHHTKTLIRRNFVAAVLLLVLIAGLLGAAWWKENLYMTAFYVAAIAMGMLITEIVAWKSRDKNDGGVPVRDGKKELSVVLFSVVVVAVLSVVRFVFITDMQTVPVALRMVLLVFVVLFIYPVFLLLYFLFVRKYKLAELGFKFHHAWVALPVIAVIGTIAAFLFPHKMQFSMILQQQGIGGMLFLGFFTAALPEEFVRFLAQTRIGKVTGNAGIGWFVASAVWALLHVPNFYSQSKDAAEAFLSAAAIMPIGLLWGLMTSRFRSIIPAVLVHGTNLWGLQNVL